MHVCEIAGGKCQCHSITYQGKTQNDMNSSLCAAISACTRVLENTKQYVLQGRAFVFASVLWLSVIIVSEQTSTQQKPNNTSM